MSEDKSYTTEDLLLFIDKLRRENKQLKEVIDEVRGFIEKHILATETEEVLLQILDKATKENK